MIHTDDGDVQLHHGDALDVLRTLPDESVQLIASSPPFWGLRDYGTGTWTGGDAECDHVQRMSRQDAERPQRDGYERVNPIATSAIQFRDACGKCGAIRKDDQIGLEETPDQWVARLVDVYRECRRVLRNDGVMFVEIGDSYCSTAPGTVVDPAAMSGKHVHAGAYRRAETPSGYKPKDLVGQPWLLAFALRADGWYLRSEIIWARPNPMPESVTDRPTKAHSTVFLLSKRPRYYWDADAIREPSKNPGQIVKLGAKSLSKGQATGANVEASGNALVDHVVNPSMANARSVWSIATEPTPFAHFATWPQTLVERMIKAGTSEHGCCSNCGAPWVRQVEVERPTFDDVAHRHSSKTDPGYKRNDGASAFGKLSGQEMAERTRRETKGWLPSCEHYNGHEVGAPIADIVPCTILDPFMGSGTTALVARRLGRCCIGIDLSTDYLTIAARRLQQLSLFAPSLDSAHG